MEIKDMRKMVLLAIIAFMIGFSLLIVYYFKYSSETTDRKNTLLENDIINASQSSTTESSSTKFGETSLSYKYEDDNLLEYNEYADDVLKLKTSQTEEETTKAYDDAIKSIRLKAFAGDFNAAANLAAETLSKTVFPDSHQFASLSAIRYIGGFNELSESDQKMVLSTIMDPVVYVSLFYSMPKTSQVEMLGSEDFLCIPIFYDNMPSFLGVSEGGALESKAGNYFSILSDAYISKVKISLDGIVYDVYVTGRDNYNYRITNISLEDTTSDGYSTYEEYFKVWGRD